MGNTPKTAKEIISSLSSRYRPEKAPSGYKTTIHFDISGGNGGKFTVNVANGVCKVQEGHEGAATCTVKTKDRTYEDVELGRSNPQMAVMMGKIRLSNLSEMMTFSTLFRRLY
ncbi:MAG: SCP2 sterol-binding domain-containing protein [Chitinophagales bacterium]